jgi:hypothetical protein
MPISLSLVVLFLSAVVEAPADLPFTVDASGDAASEFTAAPRLQSFSFGQWKGRWVFIGGRIAGYHSVGGGSADFLRIDANRDIWVVDTTVRPAKTFHVPVDQLPSDLAPVKNQWTSTGQLYFQDKDQLYICGGYGQDHAGNWVTFPVISRVDLPKVIDEVMRGRLSGKGIAFGQSPLAQSTGGGLIMLQDGYFYLVMGHNFQGSYAAFEGQGEHSAEAASQTYLNEIRKFKITAAGDRSLHVCLAEKFEDVTEFHRRDLNVRPIFWIWNRYVEPELWLVYIYGGIRAFPYQFPYNKTAAPYRAGTVPTRASELILKVYFEAKRR